MPLGVGAGIYINQIATPWEQHIIKPAIEFISAIPSVVLGFFGVAVLGEGLLHRSLSQLGHSCRTFEQRLNILTAGILLAFMAVPTIFTLTEDAINNVPRAFKEASYALGANRLQTIWRIILPASLSGVISAVLLGFGRVIGETMVVLLCAGNRIADSADERRARCRFPAGPHHDRHHRAGTRRGGKRQHRLARALHGRPAALPHFARDQFPRPARGAEIQDLDRLNENHERRSPAILILFQFRHDRRTHPFRPTLTRRRRRLLAAARVHLHHPRSSACSSSRSSSTRARPPSSARSASTAMCPFIHNDFLFTKPQTLHVFKYKGEIEADVGGRLLRLQAASAPTPSSARDRAAANAPARRRRARRASSRHTGIDPNDITDHETYSYAAGGIWPQIVGTVLLVIGSMTIALVLGIFSAIYLSEYSKQGPIISAIRLAIINLAGVPSIVFGLFGVGALRPSPSAGTSRSWRAGSRSRSWSCP